MRIFHISISASSCSTSMPLILSGELRLRACGRRAEARGGGRGAGTRSNAETRSKATLAAKAADKNPAEIEE